MQLLALQGMRSLSDHEWCSLVFVTMKMVMAIHTLHPPKERSNQNRDKTDKTQNSDRSVCNAAHSIRSCWKITSRTNKTSQNSSFLWGEICSTSCWKCSDLPTNPLWGLGGLAASLFVFLLQRCGLSSCRGILTKEKETELVQPEKPKKRSSAVAQHAPKRVFQPTFAAPKKALGLLV
eukprot:404153-Amphidinium_carterae.1